MDQLELAYLSGTEALARFAAGTLSPVELLDAVIARAEVVELRVNAIADRIGAQRDVPFARNATAGPLRYEFHLCTKGRTYSFARA